MGDSSKDKQHNMVPKMNEGQTHGGDEDYVVIASIVLAKRSSLVHRI